MKYQRRNLLPGDDLDQFIARRCLLWVPGTDYGDWIWPQEWAGTWFRVISDNLDHEEFAPSTNDEHAFFLLRALVKIGVRLGSLPDKSVYAAIGPSPRVADVADTYAGAISLAAFRWATQ